MSPPALASEGAQGPAPALDFRAEGNLYSVPALHGHPLRYQKTVYEGEYWCNICSRGYRSAVYHCSKPECGFDACMHCFLCARRAEPLGPDDPADILTAVDNPHGHVEGERYPCVDHPAHPLKFLSGQQRRSPDQLWACDICKTGGISSVYTCEECGFDAHPRCLRQSGDAGHLVGEGDRLQCEEHACALLCTAAPAVVWGCDECGAAGEGLHWSCRKCNWDAHLACVHAIQTA
jgi:hypothetical protein